MEALINEIAKDTKLREVAYYTQSAWLGHAPFLKFLIRELNPETYVELGVHNGFSYFVACQAIVENSLRTSTFAVDHWKGDSQAGFFNEEIYQQVQNQNQRYSSFSTLLKMGFDQAATQFAPNSIELLHIDGFHTFNEVSHDFESWLPLMSKEGIILFHDIHVYRDDFGVYELWQSLKSKYKTIEFTHSHGLGVLFLGEIKSSKLSKLVDIFYDGGDKLVLGVFGSLGTDVAQGLKDLEIDRLSSNLNAIKSSRLWKLSAPLRAIVRRYRRIS
jgi:hypothetical protein